MTPKEKKGMRSYVQGRQGAQPTFDDLRAEVTMPGSNTARTRSPQNAPNPPGRSQQLPRHGERAPGEPSRFFDTDTSSIGDTSTTVSMPVNYTPVEPARDTAPRVAHPQSDGDNSLATDEEYVDGEYEDEDDPYEGLPRNPLEKRANQKHEMPPPVAGGGQKRKPDGSGLPYMKGDSYPTTTDGVPSISDVAEKGRHQVQAQGMPPAQAAQMHTVGHRTAPQAVQSQNQAQRRQSREQLLEENGHQQRGLYQNPSMAHMQVQGHVNPASSKPAPSKLAVSPSVTKPAPQPRAPHVHHETDSQHPVSTNPGQVGAIDRSNERRPQQQPVPVSAPVQNLTTVVLQPHQERSKPSGRNVHRVHPVDQPVQQLERIPQHKNAQRERPTVDEQTFAEDPFDFDQLEHLQQQQQQDEKPPFDYDEPDLYNMNYKDIIAANFDNDPRAADFSMAGNNMEEKMFAASGMDVNGQTRFFSTLDMDQWEEAGDWFLSRFGTLLANIKSARQDKRKAARTFEDEIERRHTAVGKKCKLTEDALGEMKASGAMVLHGTPKKGKRTV